MQQELSCTRCGGGLVSGARVCRSCGAVVQTTAATAAPEVDLDMTVDRSSLHRLLAETPGPAEPPRHQAALHDAPLIEQAAPEESRGPSARAPFALLGGVDRSWSGRWNRGIRLARLSLDLIRRQPGLLWVPTTAVGIIVVLYLLAFLCGQALPTPLAVIFWLAAFAAMAGVSATGQAMILHRVAIAAEGGAETNSQALSAIAPKFWTLTAWGSLSLAVGTFIRALERGRGLAGIVMRLIAVAMTVAWSALTFFVIPVIVFENLSVGAAIRRSRELLRTTWGEGVIGVGVLSLVFNVMGLAAFLLAVLLAAAHVWVLAVLVILAAIIGINLLSCVASPVFTYVLYRYATTGQVAFGLSAEDMAAGFRTRKRRIRSAVGA